MSLNFSFIKTKLFLTSLIFLSSFVQAETNPGHTDTGTQYGEHGIATYDKTRHGPDGSVFLDPFFTSYLCDIKGQNLLDAGCGTGPWAIYAAQNGAMVWGIDIQEGMIDKAKKAAFEAGVQNQTFFEAGSVGELPYSNDFFDRAISINVGCNLPELRSHVKEMYRVLKKGSLAIVTAPTSFGIVFTNGEIANENVIHNITQALLNHDNQNGLPIVIQKMDEIYRATFAFREGRWKLILDESELIPGENIWRKLPKMVVPNRFHPEQEYLSIFREEGFIVKQVYKPRFRNEQVRIDFNAQHAQKLGENYVYHSPFIIYVIEK